MGCPTAIVGFTGTQRGMTKAQVPTVIGLLMWNKELQTLPVEMHHGDCIGADAEAHDLATYCGLKIIGHPPTNPAKRAFKQCDRLEPEAPYLVRNRAIVDASTFVVATPGEATEVLRSGTWSTIRHARSAGKRVYVVLPDGSVLP